MNIQKFLQIKKTKEYIKDDNKFYKYQIDLVIDNVFQTWYIQDAETKLEKIKYMSADFEKHTLKAVIMNKEGVIKVLTKECKAPVGCNVDWDKVHCAFDLETIL